MLPVGGAHGHGLDMLGSMRMNPALKMHSWQADKELAMRGGALEAVQRQVGASSEDDMS